MSLPKDSRKLVIGIFAGNTAQDAYQVARQVAEDFLNVLCASHAFCTIILGGYKYRNLDGIDHGMIIQADPLLVRMDKKFPVKFSLDEYAVTASYWRAADQAVNIYERFRNLYLIVDKVGKALSPTGTRDSEVLKKTISTVVGGRLQSLHNEAKRIATETGLTLPGNPADDIAHVLYKANRCALNHAGGIADRRPFNLNDEREVSLALKLMKNVAKRYLDHR